MTRETRIGLLVGLVFIIMFGLVLGTLGEAPKTAPPPVQLPKTVAAEWPALRPLEPQAITHSELAASSSSDSRGTVEVALSSPPRDAGGEVRMTVREDRGGAMPLSPAVALDPQAVVVPPPAPAAPEPVAVAPQPVAPPAAPVQVATYTVQAKDSLIKIAQKHYGDGMKYRKILDANRDKLPNEHALKVGQVLTIPDLPAAKSPAAPTVASAGAAKPPVVDLDTLPQYLAASRTADGAGAAGDVPVEPAKATMKNDAPFGTPTTPRVPVAVPAGPVTPVAKASAGKDAAATAKATASTTTKDYQVRPGDSLEKIARRLMKDDSPQAVQKLYLANKDRLRDPNNVPVGVKLAIPS